MTDKELFEKTQKHFNLTKKSIVVEVFNKGNFNKILNEIKGPKSPTPPSLPKSNGFFNRLAAAIPGTRGHRMRSAEARKQEAEAKSAEVKARFAQQQQMKGKQPPSTAAAKPGTASGGAGTTNGDNAAERIRIQADQYNINILTAKGNNFKRTDWLRKAIDKAKANGVKPGAAKSHAEMRDTYASAYGAVTQNVDQSQNFTASGGSTVSVGGNASNKSDANLNGTSSPTATSKPTLKSGTAKGGKNASATTSIVKTPRKTAVKKTKKTPRKTAVKKTKKTSVDEVITGSINKR